MEASSDSGQVDQFLTFTLSDGVFAIEIGRVREVIDYVTITRVPRMPEYLRGLINLRGSVVPVIDLRLILGMGCIEQTVDTCVIITEVQIDHEILNIGMLADSVQEVIDTDLSQIEPPMKIGSRLNTSFIKGMVKRDDGFFTILNIDMVLSGDEVSGVQSARDEHLYRAA